MHLTSPDRPVQSAAVLLSGREATKDKCPNDWYPKGSSITVWGRQLNGLVYVGPTRTIEMFSVKRYCRSVIDPALPVAESDDDACAVEIPYWPTYRYLSIEARAAYLDWLATGATDASVDVGLLFLYLYGLEHRFFVDQPDLAERLDLLDEARRLLTLWSENKSAKRGLYRFIDHGMAACQPVESIEPIFENPCRQLPLSVKLAVAWRIGRGEALSGQWLLSWFLCHPDRHLRTPAKRADEEFKALFVLRFQARFPQGLMIQAPKTLLHVCYEINSAQFRYRVMPVFEGRWVADISELTEPIVIAQDIANQAMDELARFSRYIGRHPEERFSLKAHELLPMDLQAILSGRVLDEPSIVRAAQLGPRGEAIPNVIPIEPPVSGSDLNPDLIASIRADTEQVSEILAEIFVGEVDEYQKEFRQEAWQEHRQERRQERRNHDSPGSGMADTLRAFILSLIAREHWSEDDFIELAASHGLMAAGALEMVNEWALASFDAPLLEEYDGYEVCQDIAKVMAKQLEENK